MALTGMNEIVTKEEAEERGMKYFYTGKPCRKGHLAQRLFRNGDCVECAKERKNSPSYKEKDRERENREENKQKRKEQNKKRYNSDIEKSRKLQNERNSENREYVRIRQRNYYNDNKEIINNNKKVWRENNQDKEKLYAERNREKLKEKGYSKEYYYRNRERNLEYQKNRRSKIPEFYVCRDLIANTYKRMNRKKKNNTIEELGYSPSDLKSHIESLFVLGMSWDNYGEWHIDHRTPISVFVSNGVTDPMVINSLSNLRPLWSSHNHMKSTMTEEEFFDSYPEIKSLYLPA